MKLTKIQKIILGILILITFVMVFLIIRNPSNSSNPSNTEVKGPVPNLYLAPYLSAKNNQQGKMILMQGTEPYTGEVGAKNCKTIKGFESPLTYAYDKNGNTKQLICGQLDDLNTKNVGFTIQDPNDYNDICPGMTSPSYVYTKKDAQSYPNVASKSTPYTCNSDFIPTSGISNCKTATTNKSIWCQSSPWVNSNSPGGYVVNTTTDCSSQVISGLPITDTNNCPNTQVCNNNQILIPFESEDNKCNIPEGGLSHPLIVMNMTKYPLNLQLTVKKYHSVGDKTKTSTRSFDASPNSMGQLNCSHITSGSLDYIWGDKSRHSLLTFRDSKHSPISIKIKSIDDTNKIIDTTITAKMIKILPTGDSNIMCGNDKSYNKNKIFMWNIFDDNTDDNKTKLTSSKILLIKVQNDPANYFASINANTGVLYVGDYLNNTYNNLENIFQNNALVQKLKTSDWPPYFSS